MGLSAKEICLECVERKLIKAVTSLYLTNVFHLPLIAVVQINNQKGNPPHILEDVLEIERKQGRSDT